MKKNYPVVILCGGMGTRLVEETETRPKPLVEIGEVPILIHIMRRYANQGFKNFILCLGYKGQQIREYFLNYKYYTQDIRLQLGKSEVEVLEGNPPLDWTVTLVDTGTQAMTGARIKRIEKYIDADHFLLTYGDGLANIDIKKLVDYHLEHGKSGTVSGVKPTPRFGELLVDEKKNGFAVSQFLEKPKDSSPSLSGFINGGFFVFSKKFFNYLSDKDECVLEREPLEKLSKDKELMMFRHEGFWQCMDTMRDVHYLRDLWNKKGNAGKAPWEK